MCTSKLRILVIFIFCFLTSIHASKECYSGFCHKTTTDFPTEEPRCLITPIKKDIDCVNFKFHNLERTFSTKIPFADIKLSAYVATFPEYHTKVTAFNLTINNAAFNRMTTRYQELGARKSYCRHIQLRGLKEINKLPNLFISCPFSNSSFEGIPYRLEYLIAGDNYEYSKKLVFQVPDHLSIDENIENVQNYVPFFYIEVSDAKISIHIQSVPDKFNVTTYRIWMINNDTNLIKSFDLTANGKKHLKYDFLITEGVHYFKVSAMHPDCGDYGCVNSTSPVISTKQPTRRLLIMIVSVVWIPPVILYAIYYFYKLYQKREIFKRINRKPNCLLVYSPTHLAHISVISDLAKYLKNCNINAMMDVLDIPETDTKDPGLWCNAAFHKADVIAVVTSPRLRDTNIPIIYRNIDNHALRLIKENYSWNNKRYITIEFPYCKPDDIPEEAIVFKKFNIPENLEKLIHYVHNTDYIQFYDVSSKNLLKSIEVAMTEITKEIYVKSKSLIENDNLLPVNTTSVIKTVVSENRVQPDESSNDIEDCKNSHCFTTKISELNLLGEDLKTDMITCEYTFPKTDSEFHIDRLDL
ncbi:uncharacterized protein LOC130667741 isoform X1 [Microplitis mediator]|uniref:uncharacterized protein LOC130667741 isoform X1 n=2 Tax=Microplitis mediator TaxID=375433 RepID=UPI002556638B|nr:uncharacterized protein LOC130667741 isoform X1 [Microplitis mediator]